MNDFKGLGFRSALAVAVAALALSGCDSDSSSSGGGGNALINMFGGNGGTGVNGQGGTGGDLYLYGYGPGGLAVTGGSANAKFQSRSFDPSFGDNPLTIDEDTTIEVVTDAPATGVAYMLVNNNSIYISDGDTDEGEEDAVTGIYIAPRATLTLSPNRNNDGNFASRETVSVDVEFDIHNRGTIVVADSIDAERSNINLYTGSYLGQGTVSTAGTADSPDAGYVYIEGDYAVINSGDIDARGADADDGGDGGYIGLAGDYYTQNSGDLMGQAGNGTDGDGGDADGVEVYSEYGAALNSGNLYAYGGDGTENGGDGDYAQVYMNTYGAGDAANSGDFDTHGGNGADGTGGDAGDVYMYTYGGAVRNSGRVNAAGGTAGADGSNGGSGGDVEGGVEYGQLANWGGYDYTPALGVFWSGAIDAQGGDAVADGTGDGGTGGDLDFYVNDYDSDADWAYPVKLLGYRSIGLHGGTGSFGGDGGDVDMETYYASLNDEEFSGGSILVHASINASGGDALADGADAIADGGDGGEIEIEADQEYDYAQAKAYVAKVDVRGDMNTSGGANRDAGSTSDGEAGYIYIWGTDGVAFAGNALLDGGDDVADNGGTNGRGGNADYFQLVASVGPTSHTGNISMTGGDGEYRGGNADWVGINGTKVTVRGNIDGLGGAADPDLAGSVGGEGGEFEIHSLNGDQSYSGRFVYAGGAGETEGEEGYDWSGLNCVGAGC